MVKSVINLVLKEEGKSQEIVDGTPLEMSYLLYEFGKKNRLTKGALYLACSKLLEDDEQTSDSLKLEDFAKLFLGGGVK